MQNLTRARKRIKQLKYISLIAGVIVLVSIAVNISLNSEEIADHAEGNSNTANAQKKYELTINKSVFEGIGKDLSPYTIIANIVEKTTENKYNLQTIDADYVLDNQKINIKAISGILDDNNKLITLQDDIKVSSGGMVLSSNKINFNIDSREAISNTEVYVDYKNSTIKADCFDTKDSSNIINFKGNVLSTFNLNDF